MRWQPKKRVHNNPVATSYFFVTRAICFVNIHGVTLNTRNLGLKSYLPHNPHNAERQLGEQLVRFFAFGLARHGIEHTTFRTSNGHSMKIEQFDVVYTRTLLYSSHRILFSSSHFDS